MRPPRGTVVVIAKEPVPGRVKTRLCPPFRAVEAAQLAEAALRDTLAAVGRARCARRVVALDGRAGRWLPDGFDVVAQRPGGLDERLDAVLGHASGPTVVVGMDTPQITPSLLDHALAQLCDGSDAVLGPAHDGGYWLVGLATPRPDAVRGVPMSTPRTAQAQLARVAQLGLGYALLTPLRDVDTATDAAAVAAGAPTTAFAAALRRCTTRAAGAAAAR